MSHSVCPWWLGYFLLNPLRKLRQNPEKILANYIKKGMTVLDIGCGMGFFTLAMANLVGKSGYVVAVDLQEKMLEALSRRAEKAGLAAIIKTRKCSNTALAIDDLFEKIDFALAFAVVHEVSTPAYLLQEIYQSLKTNGLLLFVEPKGHVSQKDFDTTLALAQSCGFQVIEYPQISWSHAVLLEKR